MGRPIRPICGQVLVLELTTTGEQEGPRHMNRHEFRRAVATRAATTVLRFADSPTGRLVTRRIDVLHRLLHNDSADIRVNGEAWLLSQLSSVCRTIFDVGAHRGDWTGESLERIPDVTVHAFEPIPETFDQLKSRFGHSDRVQLNNVALSDQSADLRMWTDGRDGTMSSATRPWGCADAGILVACTTGEDYAQEHAIEHIDILKVDVEGHELEVLRGFHQLFADGSIDVVQFEFTLWAALARHWLADYYDFFSQWDFQIGKLWPRSIHWKAYAPEDERFFICNFVAVRRQSKAAHLLGCG